MMFEDAILTLSIWIIGFLCGMLAKPKPASFSELNINGSIQSAVRLLRAIHDIKTGSLPPDYIRLEKENKPDNIRKLIDELLEIERKGKK